MTFRFPCRCAGNVLSLIVSDYQIPVFHRVSTSDRGIVAKQCYVRAVGTYVYRLERVNAIVTLPETVRYLFCILLRSIAMHLYEEVVMNKIVHPECIAHCGARLSEVEEN